MNNSKYHITWFTLPPVAFRGTDVKDSLRADSLCWHNEWQQFDWFYQTARNEEPQI